MMLSPHDHFSRPTNIAEGKENGQSKDVNVSKIINMAGVLPLLCYYEERVLSEMARKLRPAVLAAS